MQKSKSVYFDIRFGASGDMLVASLIDAGLPIEALLQTLKSLPLDDWQIYAEKKIKNQLLGTKFLVICDETKVERNLSTILSIIEKSNLSERSKKNASAAFTVLARAEAAVHGISIENVHFHEVGAIDSIIDIAAFSVALDILKIDEVIFGEIPFTEGYIQASHGHLPVPPPAVVELAKGMKVTFVPHHGEIITPTALALLTSIGTQKNFSQISGILNAHGIGFGNREYEFPSFTRAFIIENPKEEGDFLMEIVCAIDDINPQCIPYISERLFEAGALDVYCSQIVMKKNRPGILLTVLCYHQQLENLKKIIFRESTTIGIRVQPIWREKLSTQFKEIVLEGFPVRMKVSSYKGTVTNVMPEFEDIKKVALATNIPLKILIQSSMEIFHKEKC